MNRPTAPSRTGGSISAAAEPAPIYLLAGFAAYPDLIQGCTTRRRPAGPWGPRADWTLKRRGADPAVGDANWAAFSATVGVPATRMIAARAGAWDHGGRGGRVGGGPGHDGREPRGGAARTRW